MVAGFIGQVPAHRGIERRKRPGMGYQRGERRARLASDFGCLADRRRRRLGVKRAHIFIVTPGGNPHMADNDHHKTAATAAARGPR